MDVDECEVNLIYSVFYSAVGSHTEAELPGSCRQATSICVGTHDGIKP